MIPRMESDGQLRQAARFFYALKDPLRLRVLSTLARAGERTVTELAQEMWISQPLLSWHLARLRTAGLVRVERSGREARYSADLDALERQFAEFRALLVGAGRSRQ